MLFHSLPNPDNLLSGVLQIPSSTFFLLISTLRLPDTLSAWQVYSQFTRWGDATGGGNGSGCADCSPVSGWSHEWLSSRNFRRFRKVSTQFTRLFMPHLLGQDELYHLTFVLNLKSFSLTWLLWWTEPADCLWTGCTMKLNTRRKVLIFYRRG